LEKKGPRKRYKTAERERGPIGGRLVGISRGDNETKSAKLLGEGKQTDEPMGEEKKRQDLAKRIEITPRSPKEKLKKGNIDANRSPDNPSETRDKRDWWQEDLGRLKYSLKNGGGGGKPRSTKEVRGGGAMVPGNSIGEKL